jgi:hypothetical protein
MMASVEYGGSSMEKKQVWARGRESSPTTRRWILKVLGHRRSRGRRDLGPHTTIPIRGQHVAIPTTPMCAARNAEAKPRPQRTCPVPRGQGLVTGAPCNTGTGTLPYAPAPSKPHEQGPVLIGQGPEHLPEEDDRGVILAVPLVLRVLLQNVCMGRKRGVG